MFEIEGSKISLTRGDTAYIQVGIIKDGAEYTPEQGDSVRFALKHAEMNPNRTAYKDAEPLVVKDIPISSMMLKIEPEDTKELKFGKYTYDIQITFANGDVDTFIPPSQFEVLPEVY